LRAGAILHPSLPPAHRAWDPGPEPPPETLWFHPCPTDPQCRYCNRDQGDEEPGFDWSFVDAVYCISLRSRRDRFDVAVEQFHRLGLCRHVTFLRPVKGPRGGVVRAIWEAHRACLSHARGRGAATALVLEDDVVFLPWMRPHHLERAAAAMRDLPRDWRGFYLGHLPLRSYFVRPRVVRTVSASLHAYVASPRLMDWLIATDWEQPGWGRALFGYGLDAAYAALPGMYAFFPMLAVQSLSPSDHTGTHKPKRLAGLELQPLIESFGVRGGRLMQYLHALLTPMWWLFAAIVPRFGCGWVRRGPPEILPPTGGSTPR